MLLGWLQRKRWNYSNWWTMRNNSYAPHYAISGYSIREFKTGAEPFMEAIIIIIIIDEYWKIKTNITLPSQYSIKFSGIDNGLVYVLVSIKIRVVKNMDSGHLVCYVLDYNSGKWQRCEYDKITNFRGYPENVYDELLHENKQNQGKYILWKYQI